MIKIYGQMDGSFRTVSLGMSEGISYCKKLAAFSEGSESTSVGEDPKDTQEGYAASISISTGSANRIDTPHLVGMHKKHFLMLAPNCNGIDPKLVERLKSSSYSFWERGSRPTLDGILTPSTWGSEVLKKLFPDHPVIVWPHGVRSCFKVNEKQRESAENNFSKKGEFFVLHVASDYDGRKGTLELVRAWKNFIANNDGDFRLDLLVNPRKIHDFIAMVKKEKARNIMVIPGQNFTDSSFSEGMSRYHAVAQPSRAEGFGLVPLEARACGVPVLMTKGTGHADHFEGPGVVSIENRGQTASRNYLGAKMPDVMSEDIEVGLKQIYKNWNSYNTGAKNFSSFIQDEWSWGNKSAKPLTEIYKV